jgi:DNA-binding GntR family transcriptional regulator
LIESKTHQAYRKTKHLILNHRLTPGQKLIYRDLEETIHLSKTPIINALIMLEKEGLVVSKRNRGFYIRDVNATEVKQIFDLREKFEEIALDLAIDNYKNEDLRTLKQKLDAYVKYESTLYDQRRVLLDTDFHMQVARMGKNEFFINMIQQFYENIYFKVRVETLSPFIGQFKKDHRALFEAIKNRQRKESKQILIRHTRPVSAYLMKVIRDDGQNR